MIAMNSLVGSHDLLFITLDTLRYDAAQAAWQAGELSALGPYLGERGWEKRHTPASFTYAAHHAFFSGFLPTPIHPGPHPRLFASAFEGSVSTDDGTFTFEQSNLPEALSHFGYHSVCIGGTGFFNQRNALSRELPNLFTEAHWRPELGVADKRSEVHQIEQASASIAAVPPNVPVFLFINISAIHQPNWFYGSGTPEDNIDSHRAALVAVDRALAPLFERMKKRRPTFAIICADHGTAYGEDGHTGHRLGHEVVWTVPYQHFLL